MAIPSSAVISATKPPTNVRVGGGKPGPTDTIPAAVVRTSQMPSRMADAAPPGRRAAIAEGEIVLSARVAPYFLAAMERDEQSGHPDPLLAPVFASLRDESSPQGVGSREESEEPNDMGTTGYGCGGKVGAKMGYEQGAVVGAKPDDPPPLGTVPPKPGVGSSATSPASPTYGPGVGGVSLGGSNGLRLVGGTNPGQFVVPESGAAALGTINADPTHTYGAALGNVRENVESPNIFQSSKGGYASGQLGHGGTVSVIGTGQMPAYSSPTTQLADARAIGAGYSSAADYRARGGERKTPWQQSPGYQLGDRISYLRQALGDPLADPNRPDVKAWRAELAGLQGQLGGLAGANAGADASRYHSDTALVGQRVASDAQLAGQKLGADALVDRQRMASQSADNRSMLQFQAEQDKLNTAERVITQRMAGLRPDQPEYQTLLRQLQDIRGKQQSSTLRQNVVKIYSPNGYVIGEKVVATDGSNRWVYDPAKPDDTGGGQAGQTGQPAASSIPPGHTSTGRIDKETGGLIVRDPQGRLFVVPTD